ncbi:High-affinity zinc uptake system membrane protein ZnuB [Nymphon striatum]|nr:High-affinity zinc uptake system membrane protein ZnuB [Nymphon striatum]
MMVIIILPMKTDTNTMFDDFFIRALVAGIGVAIVAGPLGCFIVWRRLAYFGDTLSHAALLGVALAFLFEVNITLAVFGVCTCVSIALLLLQKHATLSSDALLGLLAHSALALGLVVLAFMTWIRMDLMGFLFGDILSVSKTDIAIVWLGGTVVLAVLMAIWKPLFAATVNFELAEAEGMNPERANIIFMLLMAAVIAIAMKIVGVLLITAMLIIPAATARRFASGPEQMALLAAIIGAVSVIGGLFGSLEWDTPAGPSIVVSAMVLFVLALVPKSTLGRKKIIETNTPAHLTKNQSLVMGALTNAEGPLSAYTILDQLRDDGFRAPLQVYRALDKLVETGMGGTFFWTVLEDAQIDLKTVHQKIGAQGRVSFGKPEAMQRYLGVAPGSVTAFGILNDTDKQVTLVLDQNLMKHNVINGHPLRNNATTSIARDDLVKFIEATGHEVNVLELDENF